MMPRQPRAPSRAGRAVLALLLAALVAPACPAGAQGPAARQAAVAARPAAAVVRALDAVGMTVSDMDRAVAFYAGALSFEKLSDDTVAGEPFGRLHGVPGARARVARMRLGDETIELTEYLAPRGRPIPAGSRSQDGWFQHVAIIVSDMERAYSRLRAHGVEEVSHGPQRLPDWNPNAGGIEAFYFRDPDGHTLEILHFPAGKGQAKWHRPGDRLFLGIDHTAIVARDTRASLAFYRDLLGMAVTGESENYGVEQERLNDVPGARLRITALRAAAGPGVELLEYLSPRDGRPYPADERASDLVHWETTLAVADAAAVARELRAAGAAFVSPDVVPLDGVAPGARRALLVRDPDGHAVRLVERP
ncbi:MAG TPA: VOC family protein [Gemmatimonadaceae bacterium]|nr:VOC family protein [Gemmatimonadaceae bacterium]